MGVEPVLTKCCKQVGINNLDSLDALISWSIGEGEEVEISVFAARPRDNLDFDMPVIQRFCRDGWRPWRL